MYGDPEVTFAGKKTKINRKTFTKQVSVLLLESKCAQETFAWENAWVTMGKNRHT